MWRSAATVRLGSRIAGQKMVRAELRSGSRTWMVYVPAERMVLNLPDGAQGRVDTLTAVAIQDCTATVGADCEIRN